jgi:adenylate cyclase
VDALVQPARFYSREEQDVTDSLQIDGRKGTLPENVAFIAIDDSTLSLDDIPTAERESNPVFQTFANGYPYPRPLYAKIVERLVSAGAKVVAFDIMFPAEKEGDAVFSEVLRRLGDHVVIGSNFERDAYNRNDTRPQLILPSTSLIPANDGDDPRTGLVNFLADTDGKIRRAFFRTTLFELGERAGNTEIYGLDARTAAKAGYAGDLPPGHGMRMFRYVRKFHPISLHEIFSEPMWAAPPYRGGAFFKDKIVFVGPYANIFKDMQATPFGDVHGPEIHLSVLAAILNHDYLTESPRWLDILLIVAGGLLAWITGVSVAHPLWRGVVLLALVLAYVGTAFAVFNSTGFITLLLGPNVALLSSGVAGLVWERVVERQERVRVRRTLERYVSKDVVKEVLDNPKSYLNLLGGERRKITILFSDVRGFTSITESAEDPQKLVAQLNEYFSEMVRIVFKHHGTLDKFIGDAVMASWGVITSEGEQEDARRAVSAALEMQRALKTLNASWKERKMVQLKIGIGINHGEAICGHLGSEEKQEVSAIGDSVNTASRLEGATKVFHVPILIGDTMAALIRERKLVRSVDLIQLAGKLKPVAVFTVLDVPERTEAPAWLLAYEEGVQLYRNRRFAEAEAAFKTAAQSEPEDGLILEYLQRTGAYLAQPPEGEWDGIYRLTKK